MKIEQHPTKENYFMSRKGIEITEYEKTKPELKQLFQKYECPVYVLGGGPSLPEDLKKVDIRNGITISCNYHALMLVDADILCFLDNPDRYKDTTYERKFLKGYSGVKITKYLKYTDYYCVSENILDVGDSGIFGTWLGCYITSGDVHLLGFNLRKEGLPEHFHSTKIVKKSNLKPKYGRWLTSWANMYKPERIKPVSGVLQELAANPPYINKQLLDFPKMDQDIAVLGGAPCLPEDLKKLPNDCYLISVNHHAFKLVKPNLMVFLDDPEPLDNEFKEVVLSTDVPKIAFKSSKYTDYFASYQSPQFPTTGHFGVWVASYITTGKIYLLGFNNYDINESRTFYESDESFWGGGSDDLKVTQWKETINKCVNKNIIPISETLRKIL